MKEKHLMIVDDEEDIRELLASMVESEGLQVWQASNGAEALELFPKHPFDAIVCDIMMPVMTGLELLQRLRSQGHQVPFVILTAFGDKKSVIEALKLGAFDFVDKPFNDTSLLRVINAALELGAELNFWKNEAGVTENLVAVGTENSTKAAAEIERIFSLVKSGKKYLKSS